ncbi:MAG: TolC family protein [Myxococcota bacterium]
MHGVTCAISFAVLAWIGLADSEARPGASPSPAGDQPVQLAELVSAALENNPRLRARFYRWRELSLRVSAASKLPEPTLSFGYFVRSVETRVGPQRARIGIRQRIPWPAELSASEEQAVATARAEKSRLDAEALALRREVVTEFWRIWNLERSLELHREHLAVLRALADSALAAIKTGRAGLAEHQQVELRIERLADQVVSIESDADRARARLTSLVGGDGPLVLRPVERPAHQPELPYDAATLEAAPRLHPAPQGFRELGLAATAEADRAAASGWPDFAFGVDWIATDEARLPGVADSGRDAWIAGLTIDLPVWRGAYSDSVGAAGARVDAADANARGAVLALQRDLRVALTDFADARRRIDLYEKTLIPKAEAVHGSVLGEYTSGRAELTRALISQGELLELRVGLAEARTALAQARAAIDAVVLPVLETSHEE